MYEILSLEQNQECRECLNDVPFSRFLKIYHMTLRLNEGICIEGLLVGETSFKSKI